MDYRALLYTAIVLICSACIAFTMTPIARVLAYSIGAVDVPKDKRRMHSVAMPLLGGVAIFTAFVITTLAFCDWTSDAKPLCGVLLGSLFIVITGVLDDKFNLNPFVKLIMQIVAAGIAVAFGITIDHIAIFGKMIPLGALSIPVTILWIVAMTNAVNLIDGLDGLSCGVSAISAFSVLLASFFLEDTPYFVVVLTAALAGSCIGFLPYNFNPAKIFMGDTGAMFLGYSLAIISIQGFFKINALLSFWIPFLVFALPIGDTFFAFARRILQGKSPFSADRGHIHHKLIDMGFSQKQSVMILYSICGILGVSAVLFAMDKPVEGVSVILIALVIYLLNWIFVNKNSETREYMGMGLEVHADVAENAKNGKTEDGQSKNGEKSNTENSDNK